MTESYIAMQIGMSRSAVGGREEGEENKQVAAAFPSSVVDRSNFRKQPS